MKSNHFLKPLLTLMFIMAGPLAAETVSESRPTNTDARIELIAVTGDFEIIGHDGNSFELSGELGEDVRELVIDGSPEHWKIELKMVRNQRGWGRKKSSELKLLVPRSARLEARTVSADLELIDLDGASIEASTVSGDIELVRVRPFELRIKTVSGDIESDGGGSTMNRMESVSGDLELSGARGRVQLQTVSGDIEIDGTEIDDLQAETVSGDIEARIRPTAEAWIKLSAHSGEVNLQLPAGTELRIEAETFSGDIRSAFGGDVERGRGPGRKLRFEADGAAIRVEAATFSGNVVLSEFD